MNIGDIADLTHVDGTTTPVEIINVYPSFALVRFLDDAPRIGVKHSTIEMISRSVLKRR